MPPNRDSRISIPSAPYTGTYYVVATTFAASDPGAYSIRATTAPLTVQPPTNLYVSALSGNTVTFRFTAPTVGPAATGFLLEGGVNPGEVLASVLTGSDAPIFTVVAPSGSFYVRARAISGSQISDTSNEIRIHVNVPVAPSAPDLFSSVVNGNAIVLGWRNTFAGGVPTQIVLDITGSATNQIQLGVLEGVAVNNLPPGTYTMSLRALNSGGSSPPSAPVTVTIPGPCSGPPAAPSNFLAYVVGTTVYVVWDSTAYGSRRGDVPVQRHRLVRRQLSLSRAVAQWHCRSGVLHAHGDRAERLRGERADASADGAGALATGVGHGQRLHGDLQRSAP